MRFYEKDYFLGIRIAIIWSSLESILFWRDSNLEMSFFNGLKRRLNTNPKIVKKAEKAITATNKGTKKAKDSIGFYTKLKFRNCQIKLKRGPA